MASRKDRPRAGWVVVACGALLTLSGCSAWTEAMRGDPVRLPEVEHAYQPSDLPIPLNFEYDEKESWAYVKFADPPLSIRSGRFVYYGDRPLQELSHWYMSQMPVEGWSHVETKDQGSIEMVFRKGDEDAEVRLERIADKKGLHYVTRMTARIRPAENLQNEG